MAPKLTATLSIGLAGNVGMASIEEQFGLADAKLYEAKTNGRDRVAV